MSNKKMPEPSAIIDVTPKDSVALYGDISQYGISELSGSIASYKNGGVPHYTHASRDLYKDIETNISVRNGFGRADYEKFRPQESTPKKQQEIIAFCMSVYRKVGIVRNVIDLMADFASQGVQIVHPNKQWQTFLRAWFTKVNGPERSERFLNMLYRAGNVVMQRSMMPISSSQIKQYKAEAAADRLEVDMEKPTQVLPYKKTIPGRYDILNPLSIEIEGGELSQFTGTREYSLKISGNLKRQITYPASEAERKLIAALPDIIRNAIKSGATSIPLDKNKISVYHYKKDDWQPWADPMTYCIFDDILMLEKMKLTDLAALDGAISQVRLWTLGDIALGIFPTDTAINKLIEILISNPGGGAFDIVWGPDLKLQETSTDVAQYLGKDKYEPVLNSIFQGLGVPQSLNGGGGEKGGFTNNFISIQTLIRRLEYGRMILSMFWNQELELVRKAMGFEKKATVTYDRLTLSDEAAEKALLLQLLDRDAISEETVLDRYGEIPEIEMIRRKRESNSRKSGKLPPKTSPWHNPQQMFDLMKIALQAGFITPGEANLSDELGERRPGEKTNVEVQQELKKQQMKKANTGVPQQGRPTNSKDSNKRKKKVVKPRGAAKASEDVIEEINDVNDNMTAFFSVFQWAKQSQDTISEIITPYILKHYNKKNVRSLSASEFKSCEDIKFAVLCSLEPFAVVDGVNIYEKLKDNPIVSTEASRLYAKFHEQMVEQNNKEPDIEQVRTMQAIVYSILQGNK